MRKDFRRTISVLLSALFILSAFSVESFAVGVFELFDSDEWDDSTHILSEAFSRDDEDSVGHGWSRPDDDENGWRKATEYQGITSPQPGSKFAYHPNAGEHDLLTHVFDLKGAYSAALEITYQNPVSDPSVQTADELIIRYRVDGGAWNEVYRTTGAQNGWLDEAIVLPKEAMTNDVQLNFHAVGNGGGGIYLNYVSLFAYHHQLTFTLDGDHVTATCSSPNCLLPYSGLDVEDQRLPLTLYAPIMQTDESHTQELIDQVQAHVDNVHDFKLALGVDVIVGEIEYYRGDVKLDALPRTAGDYTAKVKVTVDGTIYTLTTDYSIHHLQRVGYMAPQCAPSERSTYAVCTHCGGYFREDHYAMYPIVQPTDPMPHLYSAPVWEWADDYSSATAVFTCWRYYCGAQVRITASVGDAENPITSQITRPAGEGQEAVTTYTASVTFNGVTYTDQRQSKPTCKTVTFDANGGSLVFSRCVPLYASADEPPAPVRSGYGFLGWTLDGKLYDFSAPVTRDITLRAAWIERDVNEEVLIREDFEGTSFAGGWYTEGCCRTDKDWRIIGLVSGSAFAGDQWIGHAEMHPHSGSGFAYQTSSESSTLILPSQHLCAFSGATLSFWYQHSTYSPRPNVANCLTVRYRVNGGEWVDLFQSTEPYNEWNLCVIDLPAEALQANVEIGFLSWGHGGQGVGLDDILLQGRGRHLLTCSADGAVLTAACCNEMCALEDGKATLTLRAPAKGSEADTLSALATLDDLETFRTLLAADVCVQEIAYYAGETKLDAAPTAAGSYTVKATVTVNGVSYVLTRDYTIRPAPQDQQSVSIDDRISVNFLLDLDARKDVQSVQIAYCNPYTGAVEDSFTVTDFAALEKAGKRYKAPAVVAPAQLADTITVTITSADGEETLSTSIASYCGALLESGYGSEVKALATATLEYGQAANDFFAGLGLCNAVSMAGTDNAQAAVAAVRELKSTLRVDPGKFSSASFVALAQPEFRFYVNPAAGLTEAQAAALNAAIEVTGPDGIVARFVKNESDDLLLEVTGIEAATMDAVITVTVNGFGSITFSGNDFARIMANTDSTAALGAALYNYGEAAKACFPA